MRHTVVLTGIVLVNGNVAGGLNAWGAFCGAMSAVMYALMVMLNKQAKEIVGGKGKWAHEKCADFVRQGKPRKK